MTSKSSSSANAGKTPEPIKNKKKGLSQRLLLRRRLWPAALTLLLFSLCHVIGTVLWLNNARTQYLSAVESGLQEFPSLEAALTSAAADVLTGRPFGLVTAAFVGLVLALQGYAWLSNRQAVDFYESQPVPRSVRFRGIIWNSQGIFAVSFLVTLGIGLLLCAAYGASAGQLLPGVLEYILRSVMTFGASFGLGTLAVMLTGNVIVSLLAACVFLFYEPLLRLLMFLMKDAFFTTFYTGDGLGPMRTSPVYHAYAESLVSSLGWNAALCCVYLVLAFIAYRGRKNEKAGSAVLFAPVRTVVKIAVAFIGGLANGMLVYSIFGIGSGILCGVLTALIVGCVMEIIYAYDFKALFHEPVTHLVPALLVTAAFLIFSMDLTGYDRWVPAADRFTDAAVYSAGGYRSFYYKDGTRYRSAEDYYEENMHIEDREAVTKLASFCVNSLQETSSEEDSSRGTDEIVVVYRMKNGGMRKRVYQISARTDPALLDGVMGTGQFREGFFPVYNDDYLVSRSGDMQLSYSTTMTMAGPARVDYTALRDAYQKDLQKFSASFLRENALLGTMNVHTKDGIVDFNLEVYEGYDNTIALLRENGIWIPSVEPDQVRELYVGYRMEDDSGITCTDPAQIREIMEHCVEDNLDAPFCSQFAADNRWLVSVTTDQSLDYGYMSMVFREGEVPAFVLENFPDAQ